MREELSQKSKNRILTGAWVLIALQVLVLIGSIIDRQGHDPAIEALLQKPTTTAMVGTFGYLIGINALAIVLLIAGLTLWWHNENKEGKTIIALAIIALVINSMLAFL